jgi:hypothetical protein
LGFSNSQPFADPEFENSQSMFIATGSYMPQRNKVEIIKMNEDKGMSYILTLDEVYPQSKIMWIPAGAFGPQSRN